MTEIISILICAALYAIKGGQHWRLRLAVESAAGEDRYKRRIEINHYFKHD